VIKRLSMSDKYILVGHEAVPEPDARKWAEFFQNGNRKVARTHITSSIYVSTVFLGLDHSWGEGPPMLFETMVFGGEHNQHCTRCSTWLKAEVQHVEMCNFVHSNQGE